MEPLSNSFGAPADSTRIPSSDETTNNNTLPITAAGYYRTLLLNEKRGYPHAPSHGLSPPQEPARPHLYGNAPSYKYNQYFNPAISSDGHLNHPLTPPRQDCDLLQFNQWRTPRKKFHDQAPPGFAPAVGYTPPGAVFQNHASPTVLPPSAPLIGTHSRYRPPDHAPIHLLQVQPSVPAASHYHQPTTYAPFPEHDPAQWSEPLNEHAHPQGHNPAGATHGMYYADACLVTQAASDPHAAIAHGLSTLPTPAIQQWSTHGLDRHNSKPVKNSRRSVALPPATQLSQPSLGHDGRTTLDKTILAKKEALRLGAEDFRKQKEGLRRQKELVAVLASPGAPGDKPIMSAGTKRKLAVQAPETHPPTAPPHLRYSQIPGAHHEREKSSFLNSYLAAQRPNTYLSSYSAPHSTYDQAFLQNDPMDMDTPAPPEPDPIDWDTRPQHITSTYKNYKWSITHYTLPLTSTYAFAQSWLEDLIAMNVQAPTYTWHSHTSTGFIKDGTRHSFIALHNAVDPFETALATSTTSIGVYGAHWYDHEEIYWKTVAPDIKWLLQWCEAQGAIKVKGRWRAGVARASERRFHRAYWIAARRDPLRGLLNHGETRDVAHDAVEGDVEDGFEFSERDLMGEWEGGGVDRGQAEEAWQRVLGSNEDAEWVGEEGNGEYVVTGCSEWA